MSPNPRLRTLALACALAAAAMLVLIGWETDWGQALGAKPVPAAIPAALPVPLALLPEFAPAASVAYAEMIERPLLTPTRRPAPPPAAVESKTSMARGQFALVGTSIVGGKGFALLREANGTKQTRVAQGDQIKGLSVEKVEAAQVTLRQGDETEIVALKTAVAPRRASAGVPPTSARLPGASPPVQASAPVVTPSGTGTAPPVVEGRARRLVRADKGGGQAGASGTPTPMPPAGGAAPSQPAGNQTGWDAVFERMRQPR